MVRTQIYLTERERAGLEALSEASGKKQSVMGDVPASELRENLPDGRGGLVNERSVRSAGRPPCSATGASSY